MREKRRPPPSSAISRRRFLQTTAGVGIAAVAGSATAETAEAAGGDLRWQFETGSSFDGSPTVVDGIVYAPTRQDGLYALNADSGTEQWTLDVTGSWFPTVVDGTVYTAGQATDARTGSRQRTFETASGRPMGSPTIANGTVYTGFTDKRLYAFDAGSGTEQWQFEGEERFWGKGVVSDNTIYIRNGRHYGNTSQLYAIDVRSGEKRWSTETGGSARSSPTLSDGTLFVSSLSEDRSLNAYDSETGEKQWSFTTASRGLSSPTVADGTVYVGPAAGDTGPSLYAIDATTGEESWSLSTGSPFGMQFLTVVNDSVFCCTDDRVLSVSATTGDVQWTFTPDGEHDSFRSSSPIVVDGTLYVPGWKLYAIEAGVEGSSEGSRARLGAHGHHDEWAHADQQIQMHREATYSLGWREVRAAGGLGIAGGSLLGLRQFFTSHFEKGESCDESQGAS